MVHKKTKWKAQQRNVRKIAKTWPVVPKFPIDFSIEYNDFNLANIEISEDELKNKQYLAPSGKGPLKWTTGTIFYNMSKVIKDFEMKNNGRKTSYLGICF